MLTVHDSAGVSVELKSSGGNITSRGSQVSVMTAVYVDLYMTSSSPATVIISSPPKNDVVQNFVAAGLDHVVPGHEAGPSPSGCLHSLDVLQEGFDVAFSFLLPLWF